MSHDTHQAHGKENKTIISFKNSFWLVIILVGLFIAALNFIQAESAPEEEGHGEATHEMHKAAGHEAAMPVHKAEAEPAHHAEEAHTEAAKAEGGEHK
jgi:G:T/U-mismatch repair DNA glycosylase